MLVKNWMSVGVMSIRASDSLQHALKLQKERNVKILPVVEAGNLVGIVTDRDLKKASPPEAIPLDLSEALYITSKIKIRQVMTPLVYTISPDHTIEEAADIMLTNRVSGLPVVTDDGQIVGIITRSDILRTFMSVTAAHKLGYQVAFSVQDIPGAVGEVARLVRGRGGRIAYLLGYSSKEDPTSRNVHMRIYDLDSDKLPDLLKEMGKKCKLRYVVDPFLDKREIYDQ